MGLAQMLGGCLLSGDKLEPALDVPATYSEAHGASDRALPAPDWWREFRSNELTALMEEAQASNFDIAAAVARIVQADALSRIAGAALLPLVTGAASDTRSRASSAVSNSGVGSGDRTVYNVALNASYEIDFWGKNRAALRAAEQTASASRFDREVVALSTIVTVADTYFLILASQDRLRIAREDLVSAERILKIIRDRFAAGTAGALELAQQESLVAIQRAAIPPLIEQVRQNMTALAVLVGRPPEHVVIRGGSLSRIAIPRVAPGLPSELLTQRPDIREAESKLAATDADVESARAAFFPSIQLTGQGGFMSAALRTLFGPGAAFYSVAASLAQPILDGGRLVGQLEQEKGLQEEALQNYRKAVVTAFGDVEKALVAVQQTARQEQLQREAVATSRRAFQISEERLRAGTVDLTTVLTTEQTLFTAEDNLALIRLAHIQAIVGLYQALGGGWPFDPCRPGSLQPDRKRCEASERRDANEAPVVQ